MDSLRVPLPEALAAIYEERDLVAHFGEQYAEYRRRVPMFVPRLMRRTSESELSSVKAPAGDSLARSNLLITLE